MCLARSLAPLIFPPYITNYLIASRDQTKIQVANSLQTVALKNRDCLSLKVLVCM